MIVSQPPFFLYEGRAVYPGEGEASRTLDLLLRSTHYWALVPSVIYVPLHRIPPPR